MGNEDSSIRGKLNLILKLILQQKKQIVIVSDFISMSLNENEVSVSSTKQTHINHALELLEKNLKYLIQNMTHQVIQTLHYMSKLII